MKPHTGTLDLLDLPKALAARGIFTMELCHFHVPDRSDAYLGRLKAALEESRMELWSLLIDDGDLTHPEHSERDRAWILGWIDTASKLGATCVRVIAGKQPPTDESLERAIAQLKILVMEAYVRGVRVLTDKYDDLRRIVRWAEGSHAKCEFVDGVPDTEDFVKTLEITREGGYSGPYSIVHGEASNLWESIEAQKALILPYTTAA